MDEELELMTFPCTACNETIEVTEDEILDDWLAVEVRTSNYGFRRIRIYESPSTAKACEEESDHLYCPDCKYEYASECVTCNVWYPNEDMREHDMEMYCDDCFTDNFTYCEDCQEEFSHDDIEYVEGGDRAVCQSCAGEYNECVNCNERFYYESGNYDDDDDFWCSYCWDSDDRPINRVVQSYGFRPVLMFRWSMGKHGHGFWMQNRMFRRTKWEHYYGTELEVEPKVGGLNSEDVQVQAEYIYEKYGDFLYLKRDGSIPSGFEIVSHPASFEWWQEHGVKMYADILMRLRNAGFQSHNGGHCGLHIHTNQAALTRLQLMRMIEFVYLPENNRKIRDLSRRTSGSLDTYANLHVPQIYDSETGDYKQLTAYEYGKNVGKQRATRSRGALSVNGETAELRLFRGSLRDDRIWSSLEFYDLLIRYCENGSYAGPRWNSFKNYLFKAPKQYSDLQTYFMEKQL